MKWPALDHLRSARDTNLTASFFRPIFVGAVKLSPEMEKRIGLDAARRNELDLLVGTCTLSEPQRSKPLLSTLLC